MDGPTEIILRQINQLRKSMLHILSYVQITAPNL